MGFDVLSYAIGLQAGKASGGSSSGGKTLVGASGTYKATGTTGTLNHNLGVVPFLVFVQRSVRITNSTTAEVYNYIGLSAESYELISDTRAQRGIEWNTYNSTLTWGSYERTIEEGNGFFHNANETTIDIGKPGGPELKIDGAYNWWAFGLKDL